LVLQLNEMQKVPIVFVVIKHKVQHPDGIHRSQLIVPPLAFNGLLLDGKGGIVDTAVFEEILLGFLDFDNEAIALFGAAVNVEYGFAVDRGAAEVFGILKGQVVDAMLFGQQGVEKVEQQVFVGLRAKDTLETKVSEQADVAIAQGMHRMEIELLA
jgi:hypothetical protein